MKKKRIILPEKRYEKAPSEEMTLAVKLEGKRKQITNDDRDVILDLAKLFNDERQDSINYKIYGKIRMIFRNMYTGTTAYPHLYNRLYPVSDGSDGVFDGYLPYNEFAFLRNDGMSQRVQTPTVDYFDDFTGFTQTITGTTGSTNHNTITNVTAPQFNWNIYLSYAHDKDEEFPMKYTLSGSTPALEFVSGDGIPFRITDNGGHYKLTSPVEHGMNASDYIILEGRVYYINSIGDEIYNSEKYVVSILKSQVESGVTTFNNDIVTGKRCLDNSNLEGTTSQYYVHKLKTLTDVDGCGIDKAGFESTIWADERKLLFENAAGDNQVIVERNRMESIIYDIKEPFVLSGLTNNLDYLPTDVYVSIILRNGNGYFVYPPKVGYKFNFHNTWIDQHFDGTASEESNLSGTTFTHSGWTFTSGNTIPVGTELTGAFIEYIPTEMKERVVSESIYKFYADYHNFDYGQTGDTETFTGATATNPFGYFYQPHYRVKLRELSPYVETSDVFDIENLPQNARYYGKEGLWKWRDKYAHGYIDDLGYGTDNPFINNIHYVNTEINFYLRNEELYQHKTDGIDDFNNNPNINC